MGRILIVDDESGLRGMLEVVLRRDGHQVQTVGDGPTALSMLAKDSSFELMLCDLRMEPLDGLALLSEARTRFPGVYVVIMTAFSEWDTAVRAMRLGAYNFLKKPFDNQNVRTLVKRALAARDHHLAAKAAGESSAAIHLVGSGAAIAAVQELIEQVSTTDSTVLVTGESGTGKELVARAVHYASLRADGPMVRINSGALTPSLLESELFGHVKGSFTGATEDRPGLFAVANGGTLFLDEVGELATETQVKLLRVLESGEYTPVGGRDVRTCNVRVVAATNRDLQQMVVAGTFREDLYYRLAVIPISLPPLRERGEDIALLAGHLLARHAVRLRRGIIGFTAEALRKMQEYPWPGNVRELDNRIQRGVALTTGDRIAADTLFGDTSTPTPSGRMMALMRTPLPGAMAVGNAPVQPPANALAAAVARGESVNLDMEIERFERTLVEAALKACDDNLTAAAERLGISFRQIRYKVRQLGLR